jgi:ATP dependent DNA ligase domain
LRQPLLAKRFRDAYFDTMFEFCIPTRATSVPSGPDWFHEIKYDGYRLRLERDNDRVRLITKGDWSKRFPWIVEAALKNRQKQFVIDGEAVILGVDGRSDFDALHSGKHNEEVQLYAFDMLAGDGDDIAAASALDAQGQFGAAPGPPTGWYLPERIRAGRACFGRPVTWGWKAWCRSEATGHIEVGDRRTGLRSRTGSIKRLSGSKTALPH